MTTHSPPSTGCSPAWTTRRNPDVATIGGEVARTARVLGRPLIPWQRHVADVAGEIDPAGRLMYPRVVLIVPRRAGKTLLLLAEALTVTRRRPASRAFYASHRRETAAAMWVDEWIPMVERNGLAPRFVRLRRSNGSEAMTWRHHRSTFRLLPPDGDAMRSFASDLAIIDEAREFSADQGADFEAAAFPTQATGLGGQTWIVSNAGSVAAEWLRRWRDLGRAGVDSPDAQIAYFEWAAPDGADPTDEATWWLAHPGLGYHVNLSALRADAGVMVPDTFAAEYLGLWPGALVDRKLVDAWTAGGRLDVAPAGGVAFVVEVDEDREQSCIVAAGDGPDGATVVELVDHRAHGPWIAPRLHELCARWSPLAVGWDAGGPAGALVHDLADLPTRLVPMRTTDATAAAGWFHDAVIAGGVLHVADELLDVAVAAARRRRAAGAWLFDRRQPGSGPLIAATLAAWIHRDAQHRRPGVT